VATTGNQVVPRCGSKLLAALAHEALHDAGFPAVLQLYITGSP
jgi:hypothetical protein